MHSVEAAPTQLQACTWEARSERLRTTSLPPHLGNATNYQFKSENKRISTQTFIISTAPFVLATSQVIIILSDQRKVKQEVSQNCRTTAETAGQERTWETLEQRGHSSNMLRPQNDVFLFYYALISLNTTFLVKQVCLCNGWVFSHTHYVKY